MYRIIAEFALMKFIGKVSTHPQSHTNARAQMKVPAAVRDRYINSLPSETS